MIRRNAVAKLIVSHVSKIDCRVYSTGLICTELPKKLKKSERKPWVVSVNELKRKARLEKQQKQEAREVTLKPPENGLLVKELVSVSHEVYAARAKLITCVSSVIKSVTIYTCSLCGEVHVGNPPHMIRSCNLGSSSSKEHAWERGGTEHILRNVESFHLYDRIGRAVSHKECLEVDRIPAITELCIQAGFDIPVYPTRRRAFPVYSIAGRIIDYELRYPKDDLPGEDINTTGFWDNGLRSEDSKTVELQCDDVQGHAVQGMKAWDKLRSGAFKLMKKYPIQTCGYCPEVQVGPKGHRVRNCQEFNHQMRDGQHAWQEATVDDVVPPVYVWHVQNPNSGEPLVHRLKKYYGKLPAVVEMFAQAGAQVGGDYVNIMRSDVAVPELDEENYVV